MHERFKNVTEFLFLSHLDSSFLNNSEIVLAYVVSITIG